jgi:hypothetical protein
MEYLFLVSFIWFLVNPPEPPESLDPARYNSFLAHSGSGYRICHSFKAKLEENKALCDGHHRRFKHRHANRD